MGPGKVAAAHLRRAAYVYVRQSTIEQTREHRESLQRQYELAERAVALGWPAAQVVVIDEDLGRSGAETSARSGFRRLVADVGLGQVGLVLGIEVSRLARNNALFRYRNKAFYAAHPVMPRRERDSSPRAGITGTKSA